MDCTRIGWWPGGVLFERSEFFGDPPAQMGTEGSSLTKFSHQLIDITSPKPLPRSKLLLFPQTVLSFFSKQL